MRDQLLLWGLRNAKRGAWVLPFLPLIARAKISGVNNDGPTAVTHKSMPELINWGFSTAITVAGVVFVVLFLVGGVMYLTGAGNEDTTKKARALLLDAVIGLVIVVVAWAVGNYILDLLDVSVSVDPGNESVEF